MSSEQVQTELVIWGEISGHRAMIPLHDHDEGEKNTKLGKSEEKEHYHGDLSWP